MKNNLKEIWSIQQLDDSIPIVREPILLANGLKAFVGLITVSNSKVFQIQLDGTINIHKNYLRRFHGVEIRVIQSDSGSNDITIILTDNDLLDVFVMFLEDLIEEIEKTSNQADVPVMLNSKVMYWGKLFAKIKGDLLSIEKQRGLFGELTILMDLIARNSQPMECLLSWTGPHGSNQDFSNHESAIEVKTSKATSPSINVSNELQLDSSVLDNLCLCVIHVDDINNGTNTLTKLITEIKDQLKNDSKVLDLFDEKLDRLGVPKGEEEKYTDIGFVIRSKNFFSVRDNFPAITKKTINNPAIHNVGYQIEMAALEPFRADIEDSLNHFI